MRLLTRPSPYLNGGHVLPAEDVFHYHSPFDVCIVCGGLCRCSRTDWRPFLKQKFALKQALYFAKVDFASRVQFQVISLVWVAVVIENVTNGAGDLGFDYRASQIGHSVANGSSPLLLFFGAALPRR